MKAYQEVRAEVESLLRESGMRATVLRPWYVLGPGHRWPYVLLPFYKIAEHVPSMRDGALRLGLVTVSQMLTALELAVEEPADGVRVLEVPQIRRAGRWAAEIGRAGQRP